jgi:hypothetical protein
MMKKSGLRMSLVGMVLMLTVLLLAPGSARAFDTSGLVGMLVSKLGVTPAQAEGGAGALFRTAKGRMSNDNYQKLATSVPEADSLQAKAPPVESKKSSLLGGAASMLGGKAGSSIGGMTDLVGSFKSLGMGKEMIGKFTPVVYDYVKEKGGAMVMQLLQKALTF